MKDLYIMSEKILKMLEDLDSDNDEVDARIECYLTEWDFQAMTFGREFTALIRKGTRQICSKDVKIFGTKRYTTSLDAAMSIGTEKLEGYLITVSTNDKGQCVVALSDGTCLSNKPELCPGIPRAICHARIQALEYVRKNK